METFVKAAAAVLIAVVLVTVLSKNSKDMATVLGICVCTIVLLVAVPLLSSVVQFVQRRQVLGGLDNTMVTILLKAVGVGLISEVAVLICSDSGNQGMGKALEYLAGGVILYLSIPLFTELLELMQTILGEI